MIQFLLHEPHVFNERLEYGLTILISGPAASLEINENMCKIVHFCAVQYADLSLNAESATYLRRCSVLRLHTITIATMRAVYAP